jgi:beta-1,4-mannosyl-glycoprotein beta-1,4-N-acetylglucosaminyltransferase
MSEDQTVPIRNIIDCFIFYNEFDLLYYRLSILYDIVDYFVLVESTHTFVGKSKPLYFHANRHVYEKFLDKIIHVVVDDLPYIHPHIDFSQNHQWENESFQRNAISRGILELENKKKLSKSDFILITDVDEIPDPNTLSSMKYRIKNFHICSLEMDMYYYNLYTKFINEKWVYPKILSYDIYKTYHGDCESIRKTQCYTIKNGGWHLSYFGDVYFIQNKLKSFSHQEYNTDEYTNTDKIVKRMSMSRDLFDRNDHHQLARISISMNPYLPYQYDQYLQKYFE